MGAASLVALRRNRSAAWALKLFPFCPVAGCEGTVLSALVLAVLPYLYAFQFLLFFSSVIKYSPCYLYYLFSSVAVTYFF